MKIIKRLSIVCIILYTLFLSYWMLLGFGRRFVSPYYMYNLIPFHTIKDFLHFDRFNTDIWVINLIGNICAFIPLGILLPVILGRKLMKSILIFWAGVITLELLQLITRKGSFDVDDIILNTLGFLIGYVLYYASVLMIRKIRGVSR